MRLVQTAGGLGMRVDRPPVQRRPAAILALGHVRADDMRVQLGILGPRHPVPVGRRHEPAGPLRPRLLQPSRITCPTLPTRAVMSPAHPARLPLQIGQRHVDRLLVRGRERTRQVLIADGKQDTDALRRRKRQIERRRLGPRAPHRELRRSGRVLAVHHRLQLLGVELAREAEHVRPMTLPPTWRLTPACVVVLGAARDLLLVVELLVPGQPDLAD